jgi:hypothetical protein
VRGFLNDIIIYLRGTYKPMWRGNFAHSRTAEAASCLIKGNRV